MTYKVLPARPTSVGLITAACLLLILCAAAPAARRWVCPTSVAATAVPRQEQPAYRHSAIVFTLLPEGFEPAEITLPQGRYLLAVENRTGLAEEVELQLHREDGDKLREKRLGRGKRAWKEVVELVPGRYVVSEAGHPDWVCHLTITD